MLLGCNEPLPSSEELAGQYVMNRGHAIDEIEIFPSGTYVHTFQAPGGQTAADSGEWSTRVYDGPRVFFESFRDWSHAERLGKGPGSDLETPGAWPARIRRPLRGGLELIVDDDLDWAYIKQGAQADTSR